MLQRIWQENYPLFRSIARTILFHGANIDDVLQEAYARILQSKKRFTTEEEAYNYVRQVVRRTTIDQYRRLRRQHAYLTLVGDFREYSATLVQEGEDALGQLIRKEEHRRQVELLREVREALRELAPEQREAILLIFGRNRAMKEICREIGIPYSTLRSRMLSGIDRIRALLREKGIYQEESES